MGNGSNALGTKFSNGQFARWPPGNTAPEDLDRTNFLEQKVQNDVTNFNAKSYLNFRQLEFDECLLKNIFFLKFFLLTVTIGQ